MFSTTPATPASAPSSKPSSRPFPGQPSAAASASGTGGEAAILATLLPTNSAEAQAANSAEAQAWQAERERARIRRKTDIIAESLDSDDLDELLQWNRILDERGEENTQIIGTILRRDIRAYRRSAWSFRALLAAVAAAGLLLLPALGDALQNGPPGRVSCLFVPVWLALPFLLAWHDAYQSGKRRMQNAVILLYKRRTKESVRSLLEAMTRADAQTRAMAARGLTTLLPCLEATDAGAFGAKHHACLRHALRGYDSYLILAVLSTLEKIDDASDLTSVQRLTDCPSWMAKSDTIRRQARACLTLLQTRARKDRLTQSLLRPATGTAAASLLLRAASPFHLAEAQNLLRAAYHGAADCRPVSDSAAPIAARADCGTQETHPDAPREAQASVPSPDACAVSLVFSKFTRPR